MHLTVIGFLPDYLGDPEYAQDAPDADDEDVEETFQEDDEEDAAAPAAGASPVDAAPPGYQPGDMSRKYSCLA